MATGTTEKPQATMTATPQEEHHWLDKLVGEWTSEGEAWEPGKPEGQVKRERFAGIERVRSLGGLWTVAEAEGDMPGAGHGTSIMTLGYDPERRRYVGSWIGSMMTHMWKYDGTLDSTQRVLTLGTEGPGMTPDSKVAKYRDVLEFKTNDHRVLTSQILKDDGTWEQFMTVNYHRKK
jgi:hypothetical protein